MFEYAISAGSGTLIDYGVSQSSEIGENGLLMSLLFWASYHSGAHFDSSQGMSVMIGPCDNECETGT